MGVFLLQKYVCDLEVVVDVVRLEEGWFLHYNLTSE